MEKIICSTNTLYLCWRSLKPTVNTNRFVLVLAYIDRQHKYRVFVMMDGSSDCRHKKFEVAGQILSVLVMAYDYVRHE
jgi:hypothetical protein